MKSLKFFSLRGLSIFDQLCCEELLLRHTDQNCFIFNHGSKDTRIVLGFSGKAEELINSNASKRDNIKAIRRYSGGGTVVVDENTIFASFLMNSADVACAPFPREIMRWTEEHVYSSVFSKIIANPLQNSFKLLEHDYVLGEKKFGGNAQTIIKNRWMHHTSFLWDFEDSNMQYLQLPNRRPAYRADRPHSSFLTKMKEVSSSIDDFQSAIADELSKTFLVEHCNQQQFDEFREFTFLNNPSFVPRTVKYNMI